MTWVLGLLAVGVWAWLLRLAVRREARIERETESDYGWPQENGMRRMK